MSQHGVYRGLHSSLFDDPDYQLLSADARLVLLTARLCRDAGPAVIFRYYPELLCRQTGLSRSRFDKALEGLAKDNWIYSDGVVLWVRNGLRHDPNLRLADRKHFASVCRQLDGLPTSPLVAKFCDYYGITRPSEGPSETSLGMRSEKVVGSRKKESPYIPLAASPQTQTNGHQRSRKAQGIAATMAWVSIMKAVRAGMGSTPPFKDPRVAPALEAMGGWRRVSHLNNRDTNEVTVATVRKEFMQTYEAVS